MSIINEHNFTGTNGVNVDTLTPTPGPGSAHTKISGVDMLIQDNRAYANGATCLYDMVDVPVYPYRVTALIHCLTVLAGEYSTVQVRGSSLGKSCEIVWNAGANAALIRFNTVTFNFTAAAATDYRMDVVMHSATEATIYLDGVPVLGGRQTFTTIGTPLSPRYRNETVASSSTTGAHFDLTRIANLGAAHPLVTGRPLAPLIGGGLVSV